MDRFKTFAADFKKSGGPSPCRQIQWTFLILLGFFYLTIGFLLFALKPPSHILLSLITLHLLLGGYLIYRLRQLLTRPLQLTVNLLSAIREGDYSLTAVVPEKSRADLFNEILFEANQISDSLRAGRFKQMEADLLLKGVMRGVEVAVLAFDPREKLFLINPAGERLLGITGDQALGKDAPSIGLGHCLNAESRDPMEITLGSDKRRWACTRSVFHAEGKPHTLLFLTDVSKALRDEERAAWKKLIRVLGHELNNSLAPVQSLARSLEKVTDSEDDLNSWKEDLKEGLSLIASRAENLSTFMSGFSSLAKLPPPQKRAFPLQPMLQRVLQLQNAPNLSMDPGPDSDLFADCEQLEQALINILKNALEATSETGGRVILTWGFSSPGQCEIRVLDEGHGVANPDNLFVPFFSTKPGGSGIGLILSQQIAEAHDGSFILKNREDRPGCEAILSLPGNADQQE